MQRYYITDRSQLGGMDRLMDCIARNIAERVDLIQIREKDLSARELLALTRRVLGLPNPGGTKILVNGRVDIALAAGAHGAHLPADSIPPTRFRSCVPPGFVFGVSTHTREEVLAADREGADLVVFGPVFEPISKASPLPPRGIDELKSVIASVKTPVFALGGITRANAHLCLQAGAAGIAGISIFQQN